MGKNCIFFYTTYIKKTNNRHKSCIATYNRLFTGAILVCLALAVVFSSAVPSEAGMVYGHVFLDGGAFPPQGELMFSDAEGNIFTIRADQNGNYNGFLPPGLYTVKFEQEGVAWSATIRSYPNPVKQDIRMRRQ